MVPWEWLGVAVFVGAVIGFFVAALCMMSGRWRE